MNNKSSGITIKINVDSKDAIRKVKELTEAFIKLNKVRRRWWQFLK